MSDIKLYSERELIVAKRTENARARCSALESVGILDHRQWRDDSPCAICVEAATRRNPLPKVTRPRVVKDPHLGFDQNWRCVDGVLQWRVPETESSGGWYDLKEGNPADGRGVRTIREVTPERIRFWADLLLNPTEEVDE